MNLKIVFEDEHLLVCCKPAGVPVQSARTGTKDCESILKNYLYEKEPEKGTPYLAVIHRLDQPVEGLLVFAKTPAAAKSLSRQLQTSGFGKHYLAVLGAVPGEMEGHLEDYLVKDGRTNTSRICTPDTPGAKPARLRYKVIQTRDAMALAEITLDTGRHHQIRVQMAGLGCPIVGDRKYAPAAMEQPGPISGQLQLYAVRLSFRHPATGKPMSFCHTPKLPF